MQLPIFKDTRAKLKLPMDPLLEDSVWVELYEISFVKEVVEMSFGVLNRMSNPHLKRVGIQYTLQGAIEEEVYAFIQSHEEFEGYIAQGDWLIVSDIVESGYHYLRHLFHLLDVDIEEKEWELIPFVWLPDSILVSINHC